MEDVMNEDRGSGSAGIILSFMVGALTGAALAILFAPMSGKETRELLMDDGPTGEMQ